MLLPRLPKPYIDHGGICDLMVEVARFHEQPDESKRFSLEARCWVASLNNRTNAPNGKAWEASRIARILALSLRNTPVAQQGIATLLKELNLNA